MNLRGILALIVLAGLTAAALYWRSTSQRPQFRPTVLVTPAAQPSNVRMSFPSKP